MGSIKWRENAAFGGADLAHLAASAAMVPGTTSATPLVAVSRSGVSTGGLAAVWTPDELLAG